MQSRESIVRENETHIIKKSKAASEYPQSIGNHKYYRNKETRELFKNSFDTAEKSIYIISPWIDNNNYVMTDELIKKMENALADRKIVITIGYGYISKERLEKKRKAYGQAKDEKSMRKDKDWQTHLMAEKLKKDLKEE